MHQLFYEIITILNIISILWLVLLEANSYLLVSLISVILILSTLITSLISFGYN